MPNPVIFKDLPATSPKDDKNKTPAAIGSVLIHTVLVTALILVPLLIPQRIERVTGTVDEIDVISGHPLLIQAAVGCIRQWRYESTYLNGELVAVILTAKINFKLGAL